MIDKRMMYAQGQRVAKTLDGSRPGYRGDGGYQGGSGAPGSAESSGDTGNGGTGNGDNGGDNSPGRNQAQYGTPTAPAATPTGPNEPDNPDTKPKEYIGGVPFNVTPETIDEREEAKAVVERAKVKQSILDAPIPNFTPKGIEYFKDGNLLTNSFMPGDNPLGKPKFNLFNTAFNVLGYAYGGPLFAKYKKAQSIYKGAKLVTDTLSKITNKNLNKPFETVENLTKNIGLKDKNVIQSFKDSLTNNLTSKTKTEPVINTDTDNNRDGIATLENANVLQDEYKALLQKLQTGIISDEEQVRFNMLKNMLGI